MQTKIDAQDVPAVLRALLHSVQQGYFEFTSAFTLMNQEVDVRSGRPLPPFTRQITINLIDKVAEDEQYNVNH